VNELLTAIFKTTHHGLLSPWTKFSRVFYSEKNCLLDQFYQSVITNESLRSDWIEIQRANNTALNFVCGGHIVLKTAVMEVQLPLFYIFKTLHSDP